MISLMILMLFMLQLIIGVPVCATMGICAVFSLLFLDSPSLIVPQFMMEGIQSFPLMAVPFFILAGNLMNMTGISKRIFEAALAVIGHVKGGLGHVNVLASMIFAGISGAAVADAAGLGTIEVKAMTDEGYDLAFSTAITAASSTIGPIIPPSILMVLYAVEAEVSIGRVFLAGIIPGVIIGCLLMIFIYYLAKTEKVTCPVRKRENFLGIIKAISKGSLALVSPLIILWGLVGGIVTPTEAGVIAILYSIFVGVVYGEFALSKLPKVLCDSAMHSAYILFLIAVATPIGWIITTEQTPVLLAKFLTGLTNNKVVLLLVINIFLLLLGCILDTVVALIITVPILLPIIEALNVDLIHFGIIMCFNMVMGMVTPPFGPGLFIMTQISDISFEEVTKATMPFLIPLFLSLLLITYFPSLSLWLPRLLMP